jgi:two-component system phosphate regulon response regulator OmpR
VTTRLLLVEDEAALARALADNFHDEGYEVRVVSRGDEVAAAIEDERPNLVVLDIMLPGRSGLDVLRDLRSAGDTVPVLMLTAKGDVVDRVVGLELGADDYLPKPFAVRELLARVRALLRRAAPRHWPDELTLGDVRFDFGALTATGGQAAELTTHDILVMKVLATHCGELVRRIDIVEEVCASTRGHSARWTTVMALRRALGTTRAPALPAHGAGEAIA